MAVEELLHVGFINVGRWELNGSLIKYHCDGENRESNAVLLEQQNALYAFVCQNKVCYIGKTARSVRRRFLGYCSPAEGQRTNLRCHGHIKEAIDKGHEVRILVFTPITDLQYGNFTIDLAAALEESLIKNFSPPWNRSYRDRKITESAELEKFETEAEEQSDSELKISSTVLRAFSIKLGQTYYNMGFLNPGIEASAVLGDDGEAVQLLFDDDREPVVSKLNRTANSNGSVRIVGNNSHIARWFQKHFSEGDTVRGEVLDRHTIRLLS